MNPKDKLPRLEIRIRGRDDAQMMEFASLNNLEFPPGWYLRGILVTSPRSFRVHWLDHNGEEYEVEHTGAAVRLPQV